ncbi:MAG TPA: hypothetical protein VF266_14930 [Thermoanaerobaculia bacterium]
MKHLLRQVAVALTFVASIATAQPQPFDDQGTPLQKAIEKANLENAKRKKEKLGADRKDKCSRAIDAGDPVAIAKECDVASAKSRKVGSKEFQHPGGTRSAGKRVITETTLEFDDPNQRTRPGDAVVDRFPSPKFKTGDGKRFSPGPASSQSRGAALLPSPANNDDRDCVDWITGEHFGGRNVADGTARSCFDSNGKLKATLTPGAEAGTCLHTDGGMFFGQDCAVATTLVESIDEDPAESLVDNDDDGRVDEDPPGNGNEDQDCLTPNGTILRGAACSNAKYVQLVDEDGTDDAIDNDGDGESGEDGVVASTEDDCQRLYRRAGLEPRASDQIDGQCDMGRALATFVNAEAKKKGKKEPFTVNSDGTYVPVDATDKEKRKVTIVESYGVRCKRGTSYVDGVCALDADVEAAGGEANFRKSIALRGAPRTLSADDPDIPHVAMMGFTFAPPIVEWGYGVSEEVCFLFGCIEIFSARIGYRFALDAGVRLPVEIDFDVPSGPQAVLAGRTLNVDTSAEPLDFTSGQYKEFCEHHSLSGDCTRFGYPDFIDEQVPLIPFADKDGDEWVSKYEAFAGVNVAVFGIDLINFGLNSGIDLPAACTLSRLKEKLDEIDEDGMDSETQQLALELLIGAGTSSSTKEAAMLAVAAVKELIEPCGTFTTPFGYDDDGNLRSFPLPRDYEIGADCAQAMAEGKVITIGGKKRPICTGMILGVSGASMGIGLGISANLGSRNVEGRYSVREDAVLASSDDLLDWREDGEATDESRITIVPDNYDDADDHDTARVAVDRFIYRLDSLQLKLDANFEFGGILSLIPDLGGFTLFDWTIPFGDGIPVPQHGGTHAINLEIPVENYGLKVNVEPTSTDTKVRKDADTLLVEPGTFGAYDVKVRNIGSVAGRFDNFRIELSNLPDQAAPFVYGIDRNNDRDCVAAGQPCNVRGITHLRDAQCYSAPGVIRAGLVECIDEDAPVAADNLSPAERDDDGDGFPDDDPPNDDWPTTPDRPAYQLLQLAGVLPYEWSSPEPLRISVKPFRHAFTKPGVYPIRITGDSMEAKQFSMAARDPRNNARKDATDLAFVQVDTFFDPQVVILPNSTSAKPGVARDYRISGTNGGNAADHMSIKMALLDSNQAASTLTTRGRVSGCPFRAEVTAVRVAWTDAPVAAELLPVAPALLEPLTSTERAFAISVPREWAGMDDTTYSFRITGISQKDTDLPPASKSFTGTQTVIATKESMTRYIGLEIAELLATLTKAEADGVKLGGLKPIVVHPIQSMNDSALEAVLAGNFASATNKHATSIQLVEAFVKALDGGGKGLPAALFADLHKRAAAMLLDLARARDSNVTSN